MQNLYMTRRTFCGGARANTARIASMTRHDNDLVEKSFPVVFCWTKFGTEAGEQVGSIFQRKEVERRRNNGVFLWGIGNSIRPSLIDLLRATSAPEVLFSPMKSPAAKRDVAPTDLVVWCDAVGYDGLSFDIPEYSLVTSRRDGPARSSGHFALVCKREVPLLDSPSDALKVSLEEIRNLRTGSVLGASQVTSVVRRVHGAARAGAEYPVTTRARLIYPYLVRLTRGVVVPASLRLDRVAAEAIEPAMDKLVRMRKRSAAEVAADEQLLLV